MKKRMYRAVAVKELDWSGLAQRLSLEDRVIVGIDVAKRWMYSVFMTASHEILAGMKWEHLKESRWWVDQLKGLPVSSIEAVLEPSGTYGDGLLECLRQSGISVFRVHPKHVKDAHELYDAVPSRHDAKCSAVLGWLHLVGRSQPWAEVSEYQRALSVAVQTHELHQQAFGQAQNRLEAQLARFWPEISDLLDLGSASLLELLSQYGSPRAVADSPLEANELLYRVSRGSLKDEKIDQIGECADHSLGVEMLECEREALIELAQETRRRQLAVQKAKRRLKSLAQQEVSTQYLSAQVGQVTAAVLHQGLGSLLDYPHPGSLLKAAGLNLKERSSGAHQGRLTITKRGSRRVRQYLYLATLRWIRDDSLARAWHERKVLRDGGCKSKSIVALMRKLLCGLWWVARGERFESSRLFDTRQLQAGASA